MFTAPGGFEWTEIAIGTLLVVVLFGGLLLPFLIKEIRDGKGEFGPLRRWRRGHVELGPQTPSGTGDVHPGTVRNPAPGDPSGQVDPYAAARRETAIRS
jgi:hypothetical protein